MTTAATTPATAQQKLEERWKRGNYLCVGLDPEYAKLPARFRSMMLPSRQKQAEAVTNFVMETVLATAEYTAAFKPNTAFFEAMGHDGVKALEDVCAFIREEVPDNLLIYDGKRGDIGNTNEGYATAAFDICGADAITLSPYLGIKDLEPFTRRADKLCFILARTSNGGAVEFQDRLIFEGSTFEKPLYEYVAKRTAVLWAVRGNIGLVAGATFPHELAAIREAAPNLPLLIPGIGAQGGDLDAAVRAGLDPRFQGIIVNSSRAIIYTDDPRRAAKKTHEDLLHAVEKFRAEHRR